MASLVGGAGVTGALEAIEEMRDEVESMWILGGVDLGSEQSILKMSISTCTFPK